jgi:large conductance mechanosensitive channel
MLKDFAHFIREKGVLGLAVGLVVGAAVTKIVGSLVESFVTPLVGLLVGAAGNLADMSFTVMGAVFKYGLFISNLIDFLAVMLVVYLVFVKSPLNKIDKKAE